LWLPIGDTITLLCISDSLFPSRRLQASQASTCDEAAKQRLACMVMAAVSTNPHVFAPTNDASPGLTDALGCAVRGLLVELLNHPDPDTPPASLSALPSPCR
jgi:hypothetical protein